MSPGRQQGPIFSKHAARGLTFKDNTSVSQAHPTRNKQSQLNHTVDEAMGTGNLVTDDVPRTGTFYDHRSGQAQLGPTLNPNIVETWINETLEDASHFDIPSNIILKPSHKNPITGYGIDRISLTNAGIPNDKVDRIYRCLFVYSVGFFEMIKKTLQHTDNNYSIIKDIWRTYAILTEYCCKSDYQAILTNLTLIQQTELDAKEGEFDRKLSDQLDRERTLKDNIEQQAKFIEDLERETTNEKALGVKLEEEFRLNSKNHEDEVKLGLQFEQKLNHIHSLNRELETKYNGAHESEQGAVKLMNDALAKAQRLSKEVKDLNLYKAEVESTITYDKCAIDNLTQEVAIKQGSISVYENDIKTLKRTIDKLTNELKNKEVVIE